MYSALEVARYIIAYESSQGRTVSNLRLQKLLYFVQSWFLAVTGRACFADDLEAWDYGPVVPEVYRRYKIFGSTMIPPLDKTEQSNISIQDQQLIDSALEICAEQSTRRLVEISHNQDPWRNAYVPGMNNVITQDAILRYVGR